VIVSTTALAIGTNASRVMGLAVQPMRLRYV